MVRCTNEGLASHSVENPKTIQYKIKDWKYNRKLPQTSLQADDDGNPQIGVNNAIQSGTQWAKGARQLILDQLSSTSVWNPSNPPKISSKDPP